MTAIINQNCHLIRKKRIKEKNETSGQTIRYRIGQKKQSMRYTLTLSCLMLLLHISANGPEENLKQSYVSTYESIAIKQMAENHIPASITLAQGILESGCGQSALAKKSNNHFGIKCHSSWTGEKTYANDDTENECFRVYPSVENSYEDHSLFLTQNKRYASLFSLAPTDYKGWAQGLKAAGYATSPTYAEKLIQLIEELGLNKSDQNLQNSAVTLENNSLNAEVKIHENKVRYVVSIKGDSYYKISKRTGVRLRQLHKYNESLPEQDVLKEGSIIYLDPRRTHGKGNKTMVLKTKMTPRQIAQKEALKLKPFMRRNDYSSPDEPLPIGEKVFLR